MSAGLRLDTSERDASYLLHGQNHTRLKLSRAALYVLEGGRAGRSGEELAAGLVELTGRHVSAEEAVGAYRALEAKVRAIEAKAPATPAGFWVCLPLIPASIVAAVARPLSVFFRPALGVPLILAGIGMGLLALYSGRPLQPGTAYFAAYGLFLASLVAHEFGHASACARYGSRPSAIGFALYLVYPVLYSDVSAAWELRRWQRVVVDLGGIYFQAIVGVAYLGAYVLTGWQPLTLACLIIAISCLLSLNPFFKFDGYWVVSDALGVLNLGRQRARLFAYVRDRLRGRRPAPLPWPRAVSSFVALYVGFATAAWAGFILAVLPFLGRRLLTYPAQLSVDVPRLLAPPHTLAPESLQALLFTTLAVVTVGTIAFRLAVAVSRALARRFA